MTLSKRSLELLSALFGENSTMQLPAGVAAQVLEIRAWVAQQVKGGGNVKEGDTF